MGSFIRQNILPILLGGAGVLLILFGLFQLASGQKKSDVEFQPSASKAVSEPQKIMIDIEGAVVKPGVYQLGLDSRFVDALAAAGGLSSEADRDFVEKNINLVKKVSDGLKIYIPRVGEQILSSDSAGGVDAASTININSASIGDLDTLPGVGSVTAQKIIDGRPYATVDDLVKRKIVSASEFDKIKNMISAN